ncbi:hypothetical protein [Herpetosiphon gulosus]|uniref:Uncharacterized protein n=1 Tax=Herpetosiphon gulosus TaxID=1973496 RepID=A0ABP9X444_9CHLR
MDKHISIVPYDPTQGIRLLWDDGFIISVQGDHDTVVIQANQAGLLTLARHCLTLAQATVPPGTHLHLDPATDLEDDSIPLILAKIADERSA